MKTKKISLTVAMAFYVFMLVSNVFFYSSSFAVIEYVLRFFSLSSYILFALIIVIEMAGSESRIRRKKIRWQILIYFVLSILLNYFIQKDSVFINSLSVDLIAFLPGFLCTFLFLRKEKLRSQKDYLAVNGYKTDNPFHSLKENGNLLLVRFMAPFNFTIEEFNKDYKRIPSGYKFESLKKEFMKNHKIIFQFNDMVWTLDENGNKL